MKSSIDGVYWVTYKKNSVPKVCYQISRIIKAARPIACECEYAWFGMLRNIIYLRACFPFGLHQETTSEQNFLFFDWLIKTPTVCNVNISLPGFFVRVE